MKLVVLRHGVQAVEVERDEVEAEEDLESAIRAQLGVLVDLQSEIDVAGGRVRYPVTATVRPVASDEQIEALRQEAGQAGDSAQVRLCDRALAGDAAARAECARVIAEAQVAS